MNEPFPPTWPDPDNPGESLLQCNDCGVLIPLYNELCYSCQSEQDHRAMADLYSTNT